MAAIRQTTMKMYNQNSKQGLCEPKISDYDDMKLTSLSTIMAAQLKADLVKGKRSPLNPYKGPHISMYKKDKEHMFVCTNDAHCHATNNGFNRKPCGGFFFH